MSKNTLPSDAISIIKFFEGLRLRRYLCPAGKPTIGYGHVLDHDDPRQVITQEEANQLLENDLERFCMGVDKLVTAPITDNQFGALVSFSFNLGLGALQSSTLLKTVNIGEHASVPTQFLRFVYAGSPPKTLMGLVKRRLAEATLYVL